MTTTERPHVSPIVCAPWCTAGHGHTDAIFTEDQNCIGESLIMLLSLRDPTGELSVMPWRNNGKQPNIVLNVGINNIDVDVHLTRRKRVFWLNCCCRSPRQWRRRDNQRADPARINRRAAQNHDRCRTVGSHTPGTTRREDRDTSRVPPEA